MRSLSLLGSRFELTLPLSHALQAQTDPDFLSIRLYLTQRVSPAMLTNLAVHSDLDPSAAAAAADAITGLAAPTHFGRPDFGALLRGVSEGVERGTFLPGRESSLETTVGGASALLLSSSPSTRSRG